MIICIVLIVGSCRFLFYCVLAIKHVNHPVCVFGFLLSNGKYFSSNSSASDCFPSFWRMIQLLFLCLLLCFTSCNRELSNSAAVCDSIKLSLQEAAQHSLLWFFISMCHFKHLGFPRCNRFSIIYLTLLVVLHQFPSEGIHSTWRYPVLQ